MHEMKFDMSGGAAVLEAVGAIARLGLPVRVRRRRRRDGEHALGQRGQARRHRARDGRHDDRGQQHRRRGPARARRLPGWAREQGAERLVDVATLTGAIVVALGLDVRRA